MGLHWHDWGGDSVVFDDCTGQTHQFSPLASAVMAWLEELPRSAADLTAAIAADLDSAADPELRDAVDAVVEQFQQLGWIEPLTRA